MGSGNYFIEVQVVDAVFEERAARAGSGSPGIGQLLMRTPVEGAGSDLAQPAR